MELEMVTPQGSAWKGEVTAVQVPGTKGLFEVLNNHAPIISTLTKGKITIQRKDQDNLVFSIDGGVIEVLHNQIVILAENLITQ